MSGVAMELGAQEISDEGSPFTSEAEYIVDFWRTAQGLPSDTVNALLQTRDGYLWVGTTEGLARFDGLNFTLIDDDAVTGLGGAWITALLEDADGALWVGTQEQGVMRIRNGHFDHYTTAHGLSDNAVSSLAQDANGLVWIGTQGGLNVWADGRLSPFTSDMIQKDEAIVALHAGRSGVLWITTRFEVYREQNGEAIPFQFEEMPQGRNADFVGVYEDRVGDLWTYGATFLLNLSQGKRFNYFRSLDPVSTRVWTICEQLGGGLWIGTSGRGLFRFQNGRFDIAGARDGLDQCDVRALYADQEGNLWIGTSGNGLAQLRTRRWHLLEREDGLPAEHLTALAMGSKGQIYVGSADAGLFRLKGQQLEPYRVGAPFDFATHIQSLCVDRRGALWVATWGMGLFELSEDGRQRQFTTANGLDDDLVLAVAADSESDVVWAGTMSGGLHRISSRTVQSWNWEDGLSGAPVRCLRVLAGGDLLIGLEDGGLFRKSNNQLMRVPVPSLSKGQSIHCLAEDQMGRIWIGTDGAGAYCQVNGRWISVGQSEGMAAQVIRQIVQDSVGNYWFGTETGLYQVREEQMNHLLEGNLTTLSPLLCRRDVRSGNNQDRTAWPSVLTASDGGIWFVTYSGLLSVDPSLVQVVMPPRVMVEKVMVDGQTVFLPTLGGESVELRLGPGASSLDFDFTAVSFRAPDKIRFRHMLEGFDPDWVESDTARRAHYGPVPPGDYQFRVLAVNAEGIWNESGAALSLVVVPPLWRSWWVLTLIGFTVVFAIWAAVRYVSMRRLWARLQLSEQQRAMERERARIAQNMHDEIGSKLTRISFLSEAARNAGATLTVIGPQVNAIATTSRELLQALDEIVWAVNPRNDNLEHLAGYLEQYAREYFHETPVGCHISVPDQLPRAALAAEMRHNVFLAFEEALSNVLRHSGSAQVNIEMKLGKDFFEVVVRDEGVGFVRRAHSSSQGHDGLYNMKERLHSVGGVCMVHSQLRQGTTVRLRFPLDGAV